jgi:hypothetical protein
MHLPTSEPILLSYYSLHYPELYYYTIRVYYKEGGRNYDIIIWFYNPIYYCVLRN